MKKEQMKRINHDRIDRSNWTYDPKKVTDGSYVDSHMLRPYKQYRAAIDQLTLLALKQP